jgi:hypothetical protein
MPSALVAAAKRDNRTSWLATLPATVARLCDEWSLTAGAPFCPGGQTAWVAPVRDAAGADLVLKVAWRHPEALDEAEGLRVWAGRGAVQLLSLPPLRVVGRGEDRTRIAPSLRCPRRPPWLHPATRIVASLILVAVGGVRPRCLPFTVVQTGMSSGLRNGNEPPRTRS